MNRRSSIAACLIVLELMIAMLLAAFVSGEEKYWWQ